jgi:hypothetical protein
MSAAFWGFDVRSPDFRIYGYPGFNFVNGKLSGQLSIIQSGWITGISPPPASLKYINSVGNYVIKKASLLIGGQCIDEITGDRLFIENDLNIHYENQAALTILEGKNDTSIASLPRQYYTKLTFNINEIDMKKVYRQDVQVKIDYNSFESIIGDADVSLTNGFSDGKSFTNVNIKNLVFGETSNYPRPVNSVNYDKYIFTQFVFVNNYYYVFYDTTKPIELASSYHKWYDVLPGFGGQTPDPYFINEYLYMSVFRYVWRMKVSDIINNLERTLQTTATYDISLGNNLILVTNVNTEYTYIGQTYLFTHQNGTTRFSGDVTGYTGSTINLTIRYSTGSGSVNSVWSISPTFTRSSYKIFSNIVGDDAAFYAVQSGTIQGTYADARYLYMYCYINYNASVVPDLACSWYQASPIFNQANPVTQFVLTLKFFSVALLSPTRQLNAAAYLLANINPTPASVVFSTQTTSGSNTLASFQVNYSTPTSLDYIGQPLFATAVWVRYDTTGNINSQVQYEYAVSSTGFIRTINSIMNIFALNTRDQAFDGRYLYISLADVQSDMVRSDTQNFLNSVLGVDYIRYNPPYPINYIEPVKSDGRYLYFTNGYLTNIIAVYDNYLSFDNPLAWSPISFNSALYGFIPSLLPRVFDGKYMYFTTGTQDTISMSIFRLNTITRETDYILFKPNGTLTYSDGTVSKSITFNSKSVALPAPIGTLNVGNPVLNIGDRYIYISELFGGNDSYSLEDFVRYDPLVLFQTLKGTLLVKYESGSGPMKSLVGQTNINEFVMKAGLTSSIFNLSFVNPVREFWIVLENPGVIARTVLKLNGVILIDDDQTVTNTLRSYQSHSVTPTSNVCMYSFAIDPEKLQPSGTLNMSRIAYQTLEITLAAAAATDLYVRVYAKTFNVLQCQNGLGGLLFNSAL